MIDKARKKNVLKHFQIGSVQKIGDLSELLLKNRLLFGENYEVTNLIGVDNFEGV